jgi:hypothetical protein
MHEPLQKLDPSRSPIHRNRPELPTKANTELVFLVLTMGTLALNSKGVLTQNNKLK